MFCLNTKYTIKYITYIKCIYKSVVAKIQCQRKLRFISYVLCFADQIRDFKPQAYPYILRKKKRKVSRSRSRDIGMMIYGRR